MYKYCEGELLVLLVHPGGRFGRERTLEAGPSRRGNMRRGEDPLIAAVREFGEETGGQVGQIWLGEIVQPNKKNRERLGG